MDRDIPIFNRPIMQKIFKKNQELHRKRLTNIMKGHNNYTFNKSYTLSREKAYVIQEGKQLQIQRSNNILFNRMANIMSRAPNRGHKKIHSSVIKPRISEQINRINEENKSLQSRLQSQKATISNKKFAQQRRKNLTLLKFLGKYPNPEATKCKTTKRDSQYRQTHLEGQFYQSNFYDEEMQLLQTHKNINTQIGKKSQNSNRVFKSQGFNKKINNQTQDRSHMKRSNSKTMQQNHEIVLYQTDCKISGKLVLLRIIRTDSSYEVEALSQKKKQPITYRISFEQEVGNQFFMNMDYDYRKIVQMLHIKDEVLLLQNQNQNKYKKNIDKNSFFPQISKKKLSPTNFPNKYEEALEEIVQE